MKDRNRRTRTRPKKKRQAELVRTIKSLRTAEEFFNMPEPAREMLIKVAGTVSKMRADRISLAKASREFGVSPRTVKELASQALRKLSHGQYAAKANDRIFRVVIAVTRGKGPMEIATNDFRQASKAGKHSAAVHRYLETGDNSALARFKNKYIVDAQGKRIALMTDLDDLDRLGSAGELSFESLYARNL
jgi:DNA-binding CsgD family transcriptional regulator